MNQRHRLGAAAFAVVCALFLSGCGFDKYEPPLTSGISTRSGGQATLELVDIDGSSLEDLVAVCGISSVMRFDGESWTSQGPVWSQDLRVKSITVEDNGDVAVCASDLVLLRIADQWQELPTPAAYIYRARFLPDGSLWVCGFDEASDGMLARWDGSSWEVMPPPPIYSRCYDFDLLDGEDLIVDGRLGNVFRFSGGAWSWISTVHGVEGIWSDREGTVYAVEDHGLLELVDGELVPVEEHEFWVELNAVDGDSDGTLVVGGDQGYVGLRRDGVWSDIPIPCEELGYELWSLDKVRLLDGGLVLARTWAGTWFQWDGVSWSVFPLPRPEIRGFFQVDSSDLYWAYTFGNEGMTYSISQNGLQFRQEVEFQRRYSFTDIVYLGSGKLLGVTVDGLWVLRSHPETNEGPHPAAAAYRALAAGPDAEAVAVGDGGLVDWGVNGLQYHDELGIAADLRDTWCPGTPVWWAVGTEGTILYREERQWSQIAGIPPVDLNAIWGRAEDDVYAVGEAGIVLAWDGEAWSDMACPLEQDLLAVTGSSGRYVWVCGRAGALAYHDGHDWTVLDSGQQGELRDIHLWSYRSAGVLDEDGGITTYTIVNP